MILRKISFLVMLIIATLCFQSCNDDNGTENTARVQLKLIDAPGDYLEVNVNIIDVQYNSSEDEEGWRSFESFEPVIVDLTELVADNDLLLTDEIINSGMLKQIRLVLGNEENSLVIDQGDKEPGVPIELKTPSAQQSGLKLKLNEVLVSGFSYTFILDWDVQKSVIEAGGSGMYNLKPVIRVNTLVNSGSIKGKVIGKLTSEDLVATPLENISVLFFDEDELTTSLGSTFTNEFGDFTIQGLGAGNYVVKINEDLTYTEYVSESIDVMIGEVNEIESNIELLLK